MEREGERILKAVREDAYDKFPLLLMVWFPLHNPKPPIHLLQQDHTHKRLSRYCKLEIVELPDEKTPDGASAAEEAAILERGTSLHLLIRFFKIQVASLIPQ